MVWWRRWPGGGPSVQCSAFPSSAFSSRAPSPDQYRLPDLRIPSLLSLPASLPLARPPPSFPPSLIPPPPLAPGPSAGGRLAGRRQAGRQRPRRGEGEVVAAGSGGGRHQGGRPSWEPGASGCSSQGTRGPWPGPPTKALRRAALGTPHPPPPSFSTCSSSSSPRSSFPSSPPLHLACPRLSSPGLPAPPLLGLSLPPACFFHGG